MTVRRQIKLETLSVILIAFAVSSFLVLRNNQEAKQQLHLAIPIVADAAQTSVAPTTDPILKIDTASQISPDGTKKLIMKTIPGADGTRTYKFTTTDGKGDNEQMLYKTKAQESEKLSIPFNTWSPDKKYLFIQKNTSSGLVFKATGDPIASPEAFFDVADIFKQKGKKDKITEITGWASPTLLIVNTLSEEDKKGSSYWLEIPTKAIIQLSGQF